VSDAWPAERSSRGLPRLEDLPQTEGGYEREAVEQAFDVLYHHAAQLDATLEALSAVEAFRRDADALRFELHGFRPPAPDFGGRSSMPLVVLRLAAESALLIAVAVFAGISHLRTITVVELMAAAFVVVVICEWLAARSSFVPPVFGFAHARPLDDEELATEPPAETDPWEAPLEA
jgi:hypothetical protein